MIELYERYGSTVHELAHGQANALDIEMCAALGAFRRYVERTLRGSA